MHFAYIYASLSLHIIMFCLLVYIATAHEGERAYDQRHIFFRQKNTRIPCHLKQVQRDSEEFQTALKYCHKLS